jgi:hypothetical protein
MVTPEMMPITKAVPPRSIHPRNTLGTTGIQIRPTRGATQPAKVATETSGKMSILSCSESR